MQTARGKQLAQHNAQFLVEFMAKLGAELAGRMKVSITAGDRCFHPLAERVVPNGSNYKTCRPSQMAG